MAEAALPRVGGGPRALPRRHRVSARVGVPAALAALLLAVSCLGCVRYRVERVYQGELRHERFIDEDSYASFARGVELEARGELDGAGVAFERVVERDPEAALAWVRLGAVRCKRGDAARANAAFERASGLAPNSAALWLERARCASLRGNSGAARMATLRALAADPADRDTRLAVAELRTELDPSSAATLAFVLELVVADDRSEAAWGLVLAVARVRGAASLEAAARRALGAMHAEGERLEEEPAIAEVARLVRAGQVQRARAVARHARLDEVALPLVAILQGRPELALSLLEPRLRAEPEDLDALLLAALAADLAGDRRRVEALLEHARAVDAPSEVGRAVLTELLRRHLGERVVASAGDVAVMPAAFPKTLLDALRARARIP